MTGGVSVVPVASVLPVVLVVPVVLVASVVSVASVVLGVFGIDIASRASVALRHCRIRRRLFGKEWKCHPMIESLPRARRSVSVLPLHTNSRVRMRRAVRRSSLCSENHRG